MHRSVVALLLLILVQLILAVDLSQINRPKRFKSTSVNLDLSDQMPDSTKLVLDEHRSQYDADPYAEDMFPDIPIYIPDDFIEDEFVWNTTDCRIINLNSSLVTCDAPYWTEIVPEEFPDTIAYLQLNGTNITDFGPHMLAGKHILYLDIVNHHIDRVDSNAFVGMRETQVIRIKDSDWSNVTDDPDRSFLSLFHHNPELTQIILENNNLIIENVDINIKNNRTILPNLYYLSLKKNPLIRIEDYFFWNLRESNLTHLNLHSCDLRSLGGKAFAHLNQLQHVDFYNNKLLVLPQFTLPLAFANMNMESFNNLGLGNVGLYLLPSLITYSVRKGLTRLNLSENFLPDLGSVASAFSGDAFPMMEKMREVVLIATTTTDVDQRTFEHLPNLEKLDLRYNELMTIQLGFLHPNLTELDISYQCMMSGHKCKPTVEHGSVYFTLNPHMFNHNMGKLKKLRMSGLQMERMYNESFVGLHGLEQLELDNSNLVSIEPGIFLATPNLKILDLSWNRDLVKLTSETFRGLDNLEILDLSYSSHAFNTMRPNVKNGLDTGLSTIADLKHIKELHLACALNGDCKGEYQYEWPLNSSLLDDFWNLEVLDLSENALTSWTGELFVNNQKLRSLNLARNSFVFITEGMINSFKKLEWLDFSGNPITCDRRVIDFHNMVQSSPGLRVNKYKGGTGYTCTLTDREFETKTFKAYAQWVEQQDQNMTVETIIGSLVCFVTLMLIATGVVYHKRYQLMYFYLKTRKKLKESRDPELEYEFDVFVSYCKDEQKWVLEDLVPNLEGGSPPLKVCIHDKHFQVGHTVIENIAECIDKSRAFMIVLSNGFVQSKWCEFEARLAQTRMLHHKGNLIVVVKERPKSGDLNRSLKFILNTWTYARWPSDKNLSDSKVHDFYQKLRLSIYKAVNASDSEYSASPSVSNRSMDYLWPS